jgi:hypothetical protein
VHIPSFGDYQCFHYQWADMMAEMAIHQNTQSQQLNMTLGSRVFETLATNSIFTQLMTQKDFIALIILRLLILDVMPCSLV